MGAMQRRMEQAVRVLVERLASLDPGRAHPGLVATLMVEAYGSRMPLEQLAQVVARPPRGLLITPFDAGTAAHVERAIAEANLGAMPARDGGAIRLELPQASTERREQLARQARDAAEQARVQVRLARRDQVNDLKKRAARGEITEARRNGRTRDAQAATDEHVARIDASLAQALERILHG